MADGRNGERRVGETVRKPIRHFLGFGFSDSPPPPF